MPRSEKPYSSVRAAAAAVEEDETAVATIELAERSCSNFEEMLEVPVLDPWRNPLNEDSCTELLSCEMAVRDIIDEDAEEAMWLFPPMAWLAEA